MFISIETCVNTVVNFFNHPFFIIVGGVSTILIILSFFYTMFLVIKGVFPVWYRLGIGLSSRKLAIFASTEYESLKSMLVDSKIFKEHNIMQVNENDLNKAANESLFLVHWKDYHHKIGDILRIKKDSTALIVYAPQNEGHIEQKDMTEINSHRNTIVVNFRGRLLNDIMVSMITTSYEKR
jgi:hypothetical protein